MFDFEKDLDITDLQWKKRIGEGSFGSVDLVELKGASFALKRLQTADEDSRAGREVELLTVARNSPFVVRLHQTLSAAGGDITCLLLEYCPGGELWAVLRARGGRLEDADARFYAACAVEGLQHLHGLGIVYRDLKPENLLLDRDGYAKIADFGMSRRLEEGRAWTMCGTAQYAAPEVVADRGHDHRVDVWALGVLVYELLTGRTPFSRAEEEGGQRGVFRAVLQGTRRVHFPGCMKPAAVELVRQLCRLSPEQRPSLATARNYMWFAGFQWKELVARSMKAPPLPPAVKSQPSHSTDDELSFKEF